MLPAAFPVKFKLTFFFIPQVVKKEEAAAAEFSGAEEETPAAGEPGAAQAAAVEAAATAPPVAVVPTTPPVVNPAPQPEAAQPEVPAAVPQRGVQRGKGRPPAEAGCQGLLRGSLVLRHQK